MKAVGMLFNMLLFFSYELIPIPFPCPLFSITNPEGPHPEAILSKVPLVPPVSVSLLDKAHEVRDCTYCVSSSGRLSINIC
jgi:hypothetical protein